MIWLYNVPTLYKLSLHAIDWKNTDVDQIEGLPGVIKEDLLTPALVQGKLKKHLGHFLNPYIKRMDVSGYEITDGELEQLSRCLDIRALEMSPPRHKRSCHSSSILESMFSQFHLLSKLHIQRNDGVTDRLVSILAESCSQLQELDVSGCFRLTDKAAESMAHLRFLNVLNLSDTLVGDRGLAALAGGYSRLSLCELKFNNCVTVSDAGINALVRGCGRLSILVFCGCPKVSVDCQLALDSLINKADKREKIVTWTVYFQD